MNLIIDIGNSRIKYFLGKKAFFDLADLATELKEQQIKVFIVSTVPEKIQEQIGLLENLTLKPEISHIEIFDPHDSSRFLADNKKRITNLYQGVGPDRVAKLIGAHKLFPGKDIILIDFGTATVLSAITKNLEFKGGFIGLGLEAGLEALAAKTARLPNLSELVKSQVLLGYAQQKNIAEDKILSTNEQIIEGMVLAHKALINIWIQTKKTELPQAITIATGGSASFFAESFDYCIEDVKLLNSTFQNH